MSLKKPVEEGTGYNRMNDNDRPRSGWKSLWSDFKEGNLRRAHAAFWLLGFCHHFGNIILLTGSHDIVRGQDQAEHSRHGHYAASSPKWNASGNGSCDSLECTQHSTATILLAGVLPALVVKLLAPQFVHLMPYGVRVATCVVLQCASLLTVALVAGRAVSLLGVALMSASFGLGEITFLSLTSRFPASAVSYWSSGTGASGLVGSWTYVFMRRALPARDCQLICAVVPVLMGLVYWKLLRIEGTPASETCVMAVAGVGDDDGDEKCGDSLSVCSEDTLQGKKPSMVLWLSSPRPTKVAAAPMTLRRRLALIRPLLVYMLPLVVVYYAEYLINTALYELMIWRRCMFIDASEQYRWFHATYQLGVFVSRSSAQVFPIRPIWLLSALQVVNMAVLLVEVCRHVIPSIYLVFAFILFEGLLGGACYSNAFSRIHREIVPEHQEYSLSVASVADSVGISLAGFSGIPIHSAVCRLWSRR